MGARLVLLLLIGLAGPAASTPLAHREVLVNGIVLLVAERPAVPIVAVRVLVEAGAVYDPPHRAGDPRIRGAAHARRRGGGSPGGLPPGRGGHRRRRGGYRRRG